MAAGQTVGKTLEELAQAGWTEVETAAPAQPTEGYWEKGGDRITQSEITAGSRMPRGGGWTWHPPSNVGPQRDSLVGGIPFYPGGEIGPLDLIGYWLGARNVVGAVAGAAPGLAARTGAGVRAAGNFMLPYAAERGLEHLGLPPYLAIPAAAGLSVLTGRGPGAPGRTIEGPIGGRGTPVVNPRDISVPVRAGSLTQEELAARIFNPQGAVTPKPAPVLDEPLPAAQSQLPASLSPQRIQNELGIAARRAKVTLTDAQYAEAQKLVEAGHPPSAAVQRVGGTPKLAPPAPKLKVSAAEVQEYQKLRQAGKSHEQ